jgi:site-specific recombinase XerD
MHPKSRKNQVSFVYAIRSFVGYLEGTQKSLHTIKNYRLDLLAFQDFITKEYSDTLFRVDQVDGKDLERFREYLKEKGLKTNTRRRKILTVTQFMNYLSKRRKLSPEIAKKIPAPHKIERVPFTVSSTQLLLAIETLSDATLIEARNKALLWTLAETGCLVSEVAHLRFDSWTQTSPSQISLSLGVKSQRQVPVSKRLFQAIQNLKSFTKEGKAQENPLQVESLKESPPSPSSPGSKNTPWVFFGFNKFGSLGSPISSRGIELLVKQYGPRLGFPKMTPRTFRHSAVLHWYKKGIPQPEIQTLLGLKTAYAFRSYETLFKSSSETTSTSETTRTES